MEGGSTAPPPQLHAARTLDLDACCVTARRADGGATIAVGTYTLQEHGGRDGILYFYDTTTDAGLEEVGRTHTAGIFDARWGPTDLVALACSDGSVMACHSPRALAPPPPTTCVLHEQAAPVAMCTSVDWLDGGSSLVACAQDGRAHVIQLREAAAELRSSWTAHDLEAWVIRAHLTVPAVLLSGGDDAAFKGWDTRAPSAPVFQQKKAHTAGVCAIECNPHREFEVATGSYDERVRFWDVRQLRAPVCTLEVACGGGVWRVAWHPADGATLLAACMQNGFAVLRNGAVAARYGEGAAAGEHGSLGYGVGWCAVADGCCAAVTCSFYDRSVHVWSPGAM